MAYPLAATTDEASTIWKPIVHGLAEPTESRDKLIGIVQKALDAGLYYTSDVLEFAINELGAELTTENIQQGRGYVEGGTFGMEVYYARDVITTRKRKAAEASARELLALTYGAVIGVLIFNDYKMNTSCKVTALTDSEVSIEGKRGRYKVTLTTTYLGIVYAMERAFEKGKRKTVGLIA